MLCRALALGLWVALAVIAPAQSAPDEEPTPGQEPRVARTKEIELFHQKRNLATAPEVRLQAWEQRIKLQDESVFGNLLWRPVGPERQGGRVIDVVSPANSPDTLLVAFATGGLWRTEDDGITWTLLFSQESAFGIGDIAVSADGKTIFVGSGESNNQRTSYAGTGVFKSVDAGKTWQHVGLRGSHHIGRVAMNPRNPNEVWVCAVGGLYSAGGERGVYKTTDGGKSWALVLKGDEVTGAIDLVLDPRNPNVALAALYERERRAWNFRGAGKGSGVFRTTDGGKSWRKVDGLPSTEDTGRYGLAVSASNPNLMLAVLDNFADEPDWEWMDDFAASGALTPRRFLRLSEKGFLDLDGDALNTFWGNFAPSGYALAQAKDDVKAGRAKMADVVKRLQERNAQPFERPAIETELHVSRDGGRTWSRMPLGRFGGGFAYYFGKVWINPRDEKDWIVAGVSLIRTRDGGQTWAEIADRVHVDHHGFWFDARNPKKLWSGNDGGIYLSGDDGVTWRHLNNLTVAQSTTVAVDMKTPYNIYTGLQDNGTMRGPSTYRPGISGIEQWTAIGGGDGSAIAVDPRDGGDIVFIASQFGAHSGINQRTNERFSARPSGRGLRFNWVSPILISPHHPDIVYVGSQFLHRSMNGGRRYEAISPDLTKNLPNGNVPYSTLKDISESPLKFGLILVGADDGSVKMTPNGGYEWVDVSTPAKDKWVSRVLASKFDVNTFYVAQTGYREDDWTAYLWKSTDQGKTWTSIVGNLPAEPINVVREDPDNAKILYVGTQSGVWVTFDGGTSWESLHGGIPTAPVHDMVIHPREKDLVIGTHSRGVWILPLRQVTSVTPELRNADLTLFDVDNVRRLPSWGFERRDLYEQTVPATEPRVRGQFFAKAAGKTTVTIKDKDGKDVLKTEVEAKRGYNSFEISLALSPSKNTAIIVRGSGSSAEATKDLREDLRAKFISVGDYTIEVRQGDKVVSKPWKVT